ncbi:MAG: DNA alkylation repair protein [Candidatus Eisenbacteria bacterium]
MRALRASSRPAPEHPASGGYGSRMERLGLTMPECHDAAQALLERCRRWPARDVVRLAQALVDSRTFDARQVAYDVLGAHRAALASLRAADLGVLGRGLDNWASVDHFASHVTGAVWRLGGIDDARVLRWCDSPDRWWRRLALASTVSLNLPSRGGHGDTPRTLVVCEKLVDDRDEMVEKALSWALRTLIRHDREAVAWFMDRYRDRVMPRVAREVGQKLAQREMRGRRMREDEGGWA